MTNMMHRLDDSLEKVSIAVLLVFLVVLVVEFIVRTSHMGADGADPPSVIDGNSGSK